MDTHMDQCLRIWVWGRGGDGQLGSAGSSDLMMPTVLHGISDPSPKSVVCGGKHTILVTELGTVYSWGWNWKGQCGTGDMRDVVVPSILKSFTLLKALHKCHVVHVAAGDEHCLAVTSDGKLYSWGSNSDGQLGQDDVNGVYLQPRLILPLHRHRIVNVACGGGHTLCVTDKGQIYSFGRGKAGRLGLGSTENQSRPTFIAALQPFHITMVACGWSHSLALSSDGRVFSFGCGADGQLGLGRQGDVSVPFMIATFVEQNILVKSIAAGYHQSAAISVDGKLFTWGWGDKGQLGHGEFKSEMSPRLVERLSDKEATGIAFGGFHAIAVADGQCYSMGVGQHFQLGTGSTTATAEPTLIAPLKSEACVFISCGFWHSVAISRIGNIDTVSPQVVNNNFQAGSSLDSELAEIKIRISTSLPDPPLSMDQDTSFSTDLHPPMPSTLSGPPRKKTFISGILDLFRSSSTSADLDPQEVALKKQREATDELVSIWRTKVIPRLDEILARPDIRRLFQKGIPQSLRNTVWGAIIHNTLNISMDTYEQLKAKSESIKIADRNALRNSHCDHFEDSSQSSFQVIDVDVPRTFPETKLFHPSGPLHSVLKEILRCYCLYSSEVGYVQGMSFLGAMLLFYMEDSFSAFKCLANILNTHFFQSLFMMDIPQILRHIQVYNLLFERHLPLLYAKFSSFGISAEHYLLDWFMTIFGKSLSLHISSRIWDCFLLDGEVFLYRTALGILRKLHDSLMAASFEECILMLHQVSTRVLDADELFINIQAITVPTQVHLFIRKLESEYAALVDLK